jgi:hypothetical protein
MEISACMWEVVGVGTPPPRAPLTYSSLSDVSLRQMLGASMAFIAVATVARIGYGRVEMVAVRCRPPDPVIEIFP